MSILSISEIKNIAQIANLELSNSELVLYAEDLPKILALLDNLDHAALP